MIIHLSVINWEVFTHQADHHAWCKDILMFYIEKAWASKKKKNQYIMLFNQTAVEKQHSNML